MHDSPHEYKYECTKHNNCKKYFKTEAQFKRHMKTFATRDYPTKCATQYRPDIDPSGKVCPCVVYFDQQTHACACIHMVENDQKHWIIMKKYLFHHAYERLMKKKEEKVCWSAIRSDS